MAEEITVQPEQITPSGLQTEPRAENRLLKYVLFGLLGLLFLGGITYAGYWYGKMSNVKTQISKPQPKAPTSALLPTSIPTPPEKDETANWKSYTNTKHSYSFKYPPIAQVTSYTREGGFQEESPMADYVAIVKSIPEFSHVIKVRSLSIALYAGEPTFEFINLNQYVEERLNIQGDRIIPKNEPYGFFNDTSFKIITYKNITIDGKNAIRLVAELLSAPGISPGYYLDTVYIEKKPGEVWFVGSEEWGDLDKSVSMLETILGTFRFLD